MGACSRLLAAAVAIAAFAIAHGCDSGEGSGADEARGRDVRDAMADPAADAVAETGTDPLRDAPEDFVEEAFAETATDPIEDEAIAADPHEDEAVAADIPADEAVEDTSPPQGQFCHSIDECTDDEVCEFSLGKCQRRGTWTESDIALYNWHPAAAAPGDLLVIDGAAFYIPSLMGGSARVRIGSVQLGGINLPADENRMIVKVTAGMKGPISVFDSTGKSASVPGIFEQAPTGIIPCDAGTPMASGVAGDGPRHVGPYAAGYEDLPDDLGTRVFYPAECGSIRRPPVKGTWPLVIILHGNGALYLNHEHLAQLLSTWGFVSVMPSTMMNMMNEDQEALVQQVMPLVVRVRGRDLGGEHAVLAGVQTTDQVAWVGHSRGTGRAEELIAADGDLEDDTVGGIFLGPVDDGETLPGALMVFHGGKDAQSGMANCTSPYDNSDGPKWLIDIPGGNHGSFCDHKVYGYGTFGALMGDAKPTISRHRQLQIVETFAIPLMQRAFGLDQPFASVLDQPPASPDYTVRHED